MRVPKNIIKEAKYTSGGEFIDKNKNSYVGYYTELNGQFYKGKVFDYKNDILFKVDTKTTNNLLGQIFNIASNQFKSYLFKKSSQDILKGYSYRYFVKQSNINPIIIKEVDEDMYKSIQNNYLYQTLKLKYDLVKGFNDKELNEAENKMKGIKDFIKNLNYNADSEVDDYPLGRG